MSKNNISTSEKTPIFDADASADQSTGSIIKRDNSEIVEVEKVEKQEENKSALVNIENNGDNLNVADGNNQNGDNNQPKPLSEELEPTWQDTAKNYAYKTGHFLYEHKGKIFALVVVAGACWFLGKYVNVLLRTDQLHFEEDIQLWQYQRLQQQQEYQQQRLQRRHMWDEHYLLQLYPYEEMLQDLYQQQHHQQQQLLQQQQQQLQQLLQRQQEHQFASLLNKQVN